MLRRECYGRLRGCALGGLEEREGWRGKWKLSFTLGYSRVDSDRLENVKMTRFCIVKCQKRYDEDA